MDPPIDCGARFAKHDPSNIGWYQDFSENYDRVGNVLLTQGKLPEALALYKQGLEIRQRRGKRQDLSMSYEKIGDVLVAQNKLQEALDAYQQSLKMRRTLAKEYKSKSDWQRALIVSLYKVGTTTAKMGAHDSLSQAQESLRTALNLADEYSGPDRQQLIDNVNLALENLLH